MSFEPQHNVQGFASVLPATCRNEILAQHRARQSSVLKMFSVEVAAGPPTGRDRFHPGRTLAGILAGCRDGRAKAVPHSSRAGKSEEVVFPVARPTLACEFAGGKEVSRRRSGWPPTLS